MAANFRIISTNDADAATLTGADFLAALPVTNLQLQGRSRVARTTDVVGDKVIEGDWDAPRVVGAGVLHGCNFTISATIRWECWDGAGQTGTKVYDSGIIPALDALGWGDFDWGIPAWGDTVFSNGQPAYSVHWFSEIVGALSFRVTINDEENDAGYIQAKRLLIGPYFEPDVNPDFGLQMHWAEDSTQKRTIAQTVRTDVQGKYRTLTGSLAGLDAEERGRFMDVCYAVGLARDCFVSVYPETGGVDERDHSMLCKFKGQLPTMSNTNVGRNSAQFSFWEV